MAPRWIGARDGFKQVRRPITILDIGTVNGKTDPQANGVGDYVTLAPLDPLTSIIAAHPGTFSGFHALTVHCLTVEFLHSMRRDHARRAPFGLTRRRDELVVQLLQ